MSSWVASRQLSKLKKLMQLTAPPVEKEMEMSGMKY
jgi:hypothetical protein